MEIEVGKIYKCGNTFVKIIGILDCIPSSYQYLGVEWDIRNDECASCPYIGRFSWEWRDLGISAGDGDISRNPEPLRHWLKEIEEPATEMAVSEMIKSLGKSIKIFKETVNES